jgi:hypothetical protein
LNRIRTVFCSAAGIAALVVSAASGHEQAVAPGAPSALTFVPVRPIEPPAHPLPPESESPNVTRFSFIAYGDTRSAGPTPGAATQPLGDGDVVHPIHSQIVDAMIARIKTLADTPFPVRFVIQSGDAVLRGANGAQWNVSFTPIIKRLIRDAGVSYFFSVGNHDVTGMPSGDLIRMMGLHNTLSAVSRLIPPEGSPRLFHGMRYRMMVNDFAIPRMDPGRQRPVGSIEEARDWERLFIGEIKAGRDPRVALTSATPAPDLLHVGGFLEAYFERHVRPAGLRSVDTIRSRIKILKEHLGDLPIEKLEQPDIVNQFKSASAYADEVEIATLHKVLATLRAAIKLGAGTNAAADREISFPSVRCSSEQESRNHSRSPRVP